MWYIPIKRDDWRDLLDINKAFLGFTTEGYYLSNKDIPILDPATGEWTTQQIGYQVEGPQNIPLLPSMVPSWIGKSIWNIGVNVIGGLFGIKKENREKYKMKFVMGFEGGSSGARPTSPAPGSGQRGTLPKLGKYKIGKLFYIPNEYDTRDELSDYRGSLLNRLYD